MKKLIILIALISAPVLAEDYYLEPSIGAYVTSIVNSDDDNSAPAAVMASLWYVLPDRLRQDNRQIHHIRIK